MGLQSYKELKIWQRSINLCSTIYTITNNFPKSEIFGITQQIRRCSISVPSNIAEGFCRKSNREYVRYLRIAYSSLAELETQLTIAKMVGYVNDINQLDAEIVEIQKMINRFIATLKIENN